MDKWLPMHNPYRHTMFDPPRDQPVWLWREEWDAPSVRMVDELSPMMNVIGLYWSQSIDGRGPPAIPRPYRKETQNDHDVG